VLTDNDVQELIDAWFRAQTDSVLPIS